MRSEKIIRGGQIAVVLTSLLLFYKMRPYFFWQGIFLNNYFNAIITIILGLFFYRNILLKDRTDRFLFFLFGLILVSYPFVADQNFNVFVSIIPLLFLPFATDLFCKKVYDSLLTIYCVIIGFSLLIWLFSIIGLLQPYKVIPPLNELKDYSYKVYPLLVRDPSIRFCGPFDEPGVVGTISALFLCCQRSFRESKSIILLLSGICSFSLFFFLVVSVYYACSQLIAKRNITRTLSFIFVAIIGVVVISSSPVLSEMITSRLAFDSSTGMFSGDNRTSSYAWELFDKIVGTREFWFGIDNKWDFQEMTAYSSSFINIIIMNGMLFFLLIVIFYIFYGWLNRVTIASFLMFAFVFLGNLYQRPGIFNPEFVFLWIVLARKDSIFSSSSCFLPSEYFLINK